MEYRLIDLENSSALRSFAYKGKTAGFIGLGEDDVKDALKSALERMSYDVKVCWGKKHGRDIEATLGSARFVIEAVGEGSSRQHLGNNFLRVLGESLLRMTDENVSYAIALPAHSSYVELVLKIPTRVRLALRLDFYLVRPSASGYEIGVFRYLTA